MHVFFFDLCQNKFFHTCVLHPGSLPGSGLQLLLVIKGEAENLLIKLPNMAVLYPK